MHKNRFTRISFILAAAGSAVILEIYGNSHILGENWWVFVLVYLAKYFYRNVHIYSRSFNRK